MRESDRGILSPLRGEGEAFATDWWFYWKDAPDRARRVSCDNGLTWFGRARKLPAHVGYRNQRGCLLDAGSIVRPEFLETNCGTGGAVFTRRGGSSLRADSRFRFRNWIVRTAPPVPQ